MPDNLGTGLRAYVDTGDLAFNAGQFSDAAQSYSAAMGLIIDSEVERSPALRLQHVTVLHRVAAVEFLLGHHEVAEELFQRVADAIEDVRESASNPVIAQFSDEIAAQSRRHADLLFGNPDDPDVKTIALTSICQHGCTAITTPCGYSSDHCR